MAVSLLSDSTAPGQGLSCHGSQVLLSYVSLWDSIRSRRGSLGEAEIDRKRNCEQSKEGKDYEEGLASMSQTKRVSTHSHKTVAR